MMTRCSAPGKMILLGETCGCFGKPALALAIDLRIYSEDHAFSAILGQLAPMKKSITQYISAALDEAWGGPPINVETISEIPSGSGLAHRLQSRIMHSRNACPKGQTGRREGCSRWHFEVENMFKQSQPNRHFNICHGFGILVSPENPTDSYGRLRRITGNGTYIHCDVQS